MCGEDGTQRGIYKLKEKHEERGIEKKDRKREMVEKKNYIDH